MESLWLQIPEPLEAVLSEIKTVRRSITSHQISDAVVQEPLLTVTMLLVSKQGKSRGEIIGGFSFSIIGLIPLFD